MPINISTSTVIFRWQPACWLRVAGDDAASFLQGQFTNDLRPLPGVRSVYGLWLTLKGKVLADSFVLRGTGVNEFWIGSYFSPAAAIRERLESHVIADDVTVEDMTDQWAGVSVLSVGTGATLAEPAVDVFVFPGRRERAETSECVYRIAAGEPARISSGAVREIDRDEMERRRIAAGIPAVPVDVGPADLPNEAGLEADAISYTKGCYLGQEVMARLKSMGQVRRRLIRVGGTGDAIPARPAAVFAGARQVGELRSAARDGAGGWIGLAMVSRLHVTEGAKLAWAADAEPVVHLLDVP
jgi:tRNA-modifying protein YgfZ